MIVVDVGSQRVVRVLRLPRTGSMPQDVKLSPDGRTYFVADMTAGGIWLIDAGTFRIRRFIRTGAGDARSLPEPRRETPVRHQPRGRHRQRAQLRH